MTPKLFYYYVPGIHSSTRLKRPFEQGFGATSTESKKVKRADGCMFGDPSIWHIYEKLIRLKRYNLYYADHAYLRRGKFYRVTKNGRQHCGVGTTDLSRFMRLGVDIENWKKNGKHILICPPDEIFSTLIGLDHKKWLSQTKRKIKKNTDRPIVIRDRNSTTPLFDDLKKSHAVVTHESNVAVDAILYGVPVFLTGNSIAKPMALDDLTQIEKPFYPDNRIIWAGVVADNQWTPEEIKKGLCKEHIDGNNSS